MYKVYKHTTPSGKAYVGITSMPVEKRWKNGKGYDACTAFSRAIKKYGWANIRHEILADDLTKDEACEMEKEMIRRLATYDPEHGYNLTKGGEHYEATDAVKGREREAHLRRFAEHPEERHAISIRQKGRTASEATRQKMSKARKQYLKEHPQVSAAFVASIKGKKRSQKFCEHLSEINKTKVRCIETGQVFSSVRDAAAWAGVCGSCVSNMLSGRSKTAGGHTFCEVTDSGE